MKYLVLALLICMHFPKAVAEEIVLSNGEWRPFMSETMPHHGVISRIVSESFALEGVKVRYTFRPWARAYAEAAAGASHGSLVWSKGAPGSARERDFLFSDTVLEDKSVFFHRTGFRFTYSGRADLKNYKIGGVTGYDYFLFDDAGPVKMDRAANEELSIRKLLAGRFDIFPCSYRVGKYTLRTRFSAAEASNVVAYPAAYNLTRYSLVLPRALASSSGLMKKFNAGLAKLKRSGRFDQYMGDLDAGLYEGRQPVN